MPPYCDRLLDDDIAAKFFVSVLNLPQCEACSPEITSRSMASARAGVAFLRPVGTRPPDGLPNAMGDSLVRRFMVYGDDHPVRAFSRRGNEPTDRAPGLSGQLRR